MAKEVEKNRLGLWITLAIIAMFLIVVSTSIASSYNGLVSQDQNVEKNWGNVQSAYQRRADLIPNLVETVKGAKNFEQETLTKIAELRSQAGQTKVQISSATSPEQLQAAEQGMSSVLSRLLVIVEKYPDLKSNENFLSLQSQLEGTENRIKWERDNYNQAVMDYKVSVRSFPRNIIAGMFGFSADKWKTFAAEQSAQSAPNVTFANTS